MMDLNRRKMTWMAAVATAGAVLALAPMGVWADRPLATISGGGTAAFNGGEELEGFTTQFSVGAGVWNVPVENGCDDDFADLGDEWEGLEAVAGDFMNADGHFMCMLQIKGEGMVVILGTVSQGRLNADGSATLCGRATIVDHFVGEIFTAEPFAVTLREGPDGFTYYDVVTGPAGDGETVVKGKITLKLH